MEAAITEILPNTRHFLCTWHLSKNLITHVKRNLFSSKADYDKFMSSYWMICMRSDTSSVELFDSEWAELLVPIRSGPPSDGRTNALEWLESLYRRRHRWAARYTYASLTLAIHSTQRGEAVHSAIDRFCSASMPLTTLLEKLDSYGQDVDLRGETRDTLRCMRFLRRELEQAVPPIISSAARIVTPYAVAILRAQWVQSLHYSVQAVGNDMYLVTRLAPTVLSSATAPSIKEHAEDADDGVGGTIFSQQRTTSLAGCSCQYPVCTGLACRHQFAVAAHLQMHDARRLHTARHWKLMDDEERVSLLCQLLNAPPGKILDKPLPVHGIMLKADRFALLMSEFRGVAGTASESPQTSEWLLGELHRLSRLLTEQVLPVAWRGVGTSAKRPRHSASRVSQPSMEAPPVGAPVNVPSRGRPKQARFPSHWERYSSQL